MSTFSLHLHLAGGLSKPYKGIIRTTPLKGPEKICRPHYFLGLPLKGFSLCLGILATRKRVHEFLDAYLVGYLIFLQLVLYVGFNCFLFRPTVSTKYPLAQKCLFPYLYFRFAWRSNIMRLLLPLRYPIICDTLYLGGILMSMWM